MRGFALLSVFACTASTLAIAGGWETGTLNSSILFEEGNRVEISSGNLTYDVRGSASVVSTASPSTVLLPGQKHKMAKDQTRTSLSVKFDVGSFDIGIYRYDSGAIQLDGTNSTVPTVTASGDVDLSALALMVKRDLDNGLSVGVGVRENSLKSGGTVSTLAGVTYTLGSARETGMVGSLAYSIPDIALRAELVLEGQVNMPLDVTLSNGVPVSGTLKVPNTTTLNFQTGIAKDTLLYASIRSAAWNSNQVVVDAAVDALDISSDFDDSTTYSIGVGRKLSDNLSASVSYTSESGGGSTTTSGFTLRDGYNTFGLGLKYTMENLDISVGYSQTAAGDVTASIPNPTDTSQTLKTVYKNNRVYALGFKVGFNF